MTKDNNLYLSVRARVNYNHSLISNDIENREDYSADYFMTTGFLDLVDKLPLLNVAWVIDSVTLGILKNKYPDIIARIKARVDKGKDEIELTSYKNTFDSVMTLAELKLAFSKMITNEHGTGVYDIFGCYSPIYCPVMDNYTSSISKVLNENKIKYISLSYGSGVMNAFSTFVRKIPYENRYNVLRLKTDDGELNLLPYINFLGLGMASSLGKLLKQTYARRAQIKNDLIFILEFDADKNDLYKQKSTAVLKKLNKTLVKAIELKFIKHITPSEYIISHTALGDVSINQAVTKSLYSGLTAFAQKAESAELWAKIVKSRELCQRADNLNEFLVDKIDNSAMIKKCIDDRLNLLNISNFGEAVPYVNIDRVNSYKIAADKNIAEAQQIYNKVLSCFKSSRNNCIEVYPYNYYNSNTPVYSGIVKVKVNEILDDITDSLGAKYPYYYETHGEQKTLNLVFKQLSAPQKIISAKGSVSNKKPELLCCANSIENKYIRVVADKASALLYFQSVITNKTIAYINSSVIYNGEKIAEIDEVRPQINGIEVLLNINGHIKISQNKQIAFLWILRLVEDVPYLYFEGQINYPETEHKHFNKRIARLNRSYDNRWKQICPLEITTQFTSGNENYKIGYHNFLNDYKTFDLNFLHEQRNKIDCLNNIITSSYLTVTNKLQGILIAQDTTQFNSFAFCPMRIAKVKDKIRLLLNPFGVYGGKHLKTPLKTNRHNIKNSGLAHVNIASSYSGAVIKFNLMFAPYNGEHVNEKIQNDAIMFSYQPTIILK